jgi:hypothetical protein
MLNVYSRWPSQLNENVMILRFAFVARSNH